MASKLSAMLANISAMIGGGGGGGLYGWNPFWGTKFLGTSTGRGLRALKGLREHTIVPGSKVA